MENMLFLIKQRMGRKRMATVTVIIRAAENLSIFPHMALDDILEDFYSHSLTPLALCLHTPCAVFVCVLRVEVNSGNRAVLSASLDGFCHCLTAEGVRLTSQILTIPLSPPE